MGFRTSDLPTLLHQQPPKPRAKRGEGRVGRCKASSCLEARFDLFWKALGGSKLTPEYRFNPPRRWRFDYAHLPSKTAIEIEGGVWSGGRHTRGKGYEADAEKYNSAAALGWSVFRLTANMISEPHLRPIIERTAR